MKYFKDLRNKKDWEVLGVGLLMITGIAFLFAVIAYFLGDKELSNNAFVVIKYALLIFLADASVLAVMRTIFGGGEPNGK